MTSIKGRRRRIALTASLLPAAIPALVLGIALAVFFSGIGSRQGLFNASIGHAVLSLPFVILTMNARLETFDFSTLEAARDLGASPLQTFRDITLPIIRTAVIGAGLLAIALSLDEFVVTWFNIGNEMTIPVLIWGLLRRGIDPSINALASVVLVSLIAIVMVSNRLTNRSER
jgi:ABC-type spermidine/putrescine transport system permease subunit II